MNNVENYSPFYEIRQLLKLLRCICGFPIQTVDATFSRFRFVSRLEYIRFFALILVLLLEYIYWTILVLIYDGNIKTLFTFYNENYDSMYSSKIDKLSSMLFYVITMISSFVYLFVFKSNVEPISELCTDMSKLNAKLSKVSNEMKKERKEPKHKCEFYKMPSSTKTVIYGQILNLFTSMLWALWGFFFFQSNSNLETVQRYGAGLQIIYPILFFIEHLFLFFGPLACSAELIIGQIVDSIADLYGKWDESLKYSSKVTLNNDNNDCADASHSNRSESVPLLNIEQGKM